MIPQRFAKSNIVMTAPPGMDNCYDVHACVVQYPDGTRAILTCWKPTPQELAQINLGNPIWLSQVGNRMMPSALSVEDPFEETKDHE